MKHVWQFAPSDPDTTASNVVFRCARTGCSGRVGFNRPGVGEPLAIGRADAIIAAATPAA